MRPKDRYLEQLHMTMVDTLFPIRLVPAYHISFDLHYGKFALCKIDVMCAQRKQMMKKLKSQIYRFTLLKEERCHDGIDDVAQIYRILIAFVKRIHLNINKIIINSLKNISVAKLSI